MKAISRHRTFIMGFAALWIYCFHILPAYSGSGILGAVLTYIKKLGFGGVDIFLFVSSFGLVYALDKLDKLTFKGYMGYLVRRLKRLYVVVIPVALVIGLWDGWSLRGFIGRTTGLAQLFVDIYRFLWFLPCILIFYALAPFYYRLFCKARHKGLFTLVCVAIFPFLNYYLRDYIRGDLMAITTRISVFLLGFYFGYLSKKQERLKPVQIAAAFAFLILGMTLNVLLMTDRIPWYYLSFNAQLNIFIAPAITIILAWLCDALHGKAWDKIYSLFGFFGSVSFEFYAVQEWIWGKVLLLSCGAVVSQLLCFGLTLAASAALHRLGKYLSSLRLVRAK